MSSAAHSSKPPLPPFLPPEINQDDDPPQDAPASPGPVGAIAPTLPIRSIRCGCWLISYRPVGSRIVAFDGTLRVECHSAGRTASGDLYQRPTKLILSKIVVLLPPPNPAAGIPILPRSRYRYYIRVTSLPEQWLYRQQVPAGLRALPLHRTKHLGAGGCADCAHDAHAGACGFPVGVRLRRGRRARCRRHRRRALDDGLAVEVLPQGHAWRSTPSPAPSSPPPAARATTGRRWATGSAGSSTWC